MLSTLKTSFSRENSAVCQSSRTYARTTWIPLTPSCTRLERSAKPSCTLRVFSMSGLLIFLTTMNINGYGASAARVCLGSIATMPDTAYT